MRTSKWQLVEGFWLGLACGFLALAASATEFPLASLNWTQSTNLVSVPSAPNTPTLTITVTGTQTNGAYVAVNGAKWTWGVSMPTNTTAAIAATNLYNVLSVAQLSGLTLGWASATAVTLAGQPYSSISYSNSAGWGTLALSTNAYAYTGPWLFVENNTKHTLFINSAAGTGGIWLDRSLDGTNYVCFQTNNPATAGIVEVDLTGVWSYLRARVNYTNSAVTVQYLGAH